MNAIRILILGVVFGLLGFWQNSAADSLKSTCEQVWPTTKNASVEMTEQCAHYWLRYGYGNHWCSEDLVYDAYGCSISSDQFTLRQIRQMQSHLQKDCPQSTVCCGVCDRAREVMTKCENKIIGLEYDYAEFQMSFAPVLKTILAGQQLQCSDLNIPDSIGSGVMPKATLRILRNAVFARHGRPFKSTDLSNYFYGEDSAERFDGMNRPLQSKNYSDARLTAADKANIACIQNAEKKVQ